MVAEMEMGEPRHEKLSDALCEAVEFGTPTQIKLGFEDRVALLASLSSASVHKMDMGNERFEGVPLIVERERSGCIVEHDGRYMACVTDGLPKAIPVSVAIDRRTREPIIVAW